ncbi:hypothetical protein HDU92_005194 [Lobulomyces angularis]|nr:hypothetical protein HDU92_005194 [Lobulomyces angularis]
MNFFFGNKTAEEEKILTYDDISTPQEVPKKLETYLKATICGSADLQQEPMVKKHQKWVISGDLNPSENASWLNLFVARYFLEFRRLKKFEVETIFWLNEMLDTYLSSFRNVISKLTVTDLDFGDESPKFEKISIVKQLTEDLVTELEIAFNFCGNAFLLMDVKTMAGTFKSKISLNHIKGKLRVRFPSISSASKMDVTFLDNDDICSFEIDLDTSSSGLIENSINKALSKIFKKLFKDTIVYPNVFTTSILDDTPAGGESKKEHVSIVSIEKTVQSIKIVKTEE